VKTRPPTRDLAGRDDPPQASAPRVVEERRLADAGFAPHGKRTAAAGARRIEQSVDYCAVVRALTTEDAGG
jgi:hypothetical protein